MVPTNFGARCARARVFVSILALIPLVLYCSSDEASPTGGGNPPPSGDQGTFVDSPVQGLEYASGSESGVTGSNGVFHYDRHEDVQFKCGDIVLGQAPPGAIMSPLHVVPGAYQVTDNSVTNIARFLQTIDDDGNPDNGIVITAAVRTAAVGQSLDFLQDPISFEEDTGVQAVIATLTAQTTAGARPLVSATAAQNHLAGALRAAYAGQSHGKFCFDSDGGEQSRAGTYDMDVLADGQFTIDFFDTQGDPWFTVSGVMDINGDISVTGGLGEPSVYATRSGGRWYYGTSSGSFSETTNCN